MISWYIELSEHYPIITNDGEMHKTWNRFANPVERYFTGMHNESFHLTHHLRPDIPYWNIKKAHKVMLLDQGYYKANSQMGGIFTSSTKSPSLVKKMFDDYDNKEIG